MKQTFTSDEYNHIGGSHSKNVHLAQAQNAKIDKIKINIKNLRVGMPLIGGGILWLASTSIIYALFLPKAWITDCRSWLICLCVFVPPVVFITSGIRASRRHLYSMVRDLEEIDDVRATVLMIDLLMRVPTDGAEMDIKNVLSQKLMKVQRGDGYRLNSKHRCWFYKELEAGYVPLTFAIVHVIQQMKWIDAIPHLMILIQNETSSGSDILLAQQASACCDMLQELADRVDAPHILLRPCGSSGFPDQLLRSVSGTAQAMPEETAQLLRPTLGQDDAPNG